MKVHFLGAAQTVTGSCYLIEACGIRFTVDCGMHQGNSEIEARNFDTDIYQSGNIDFIPASCPALYMRGSKAPFTARLRQRPLPG